MSMTDQADERRGPGRPTNAEIAARQSALGNQQSSVKPQSSSDRATARARQIREAREARGDGGSTENKFWAPQAPDGWEYQWKMQTVLGKPDPHYNMHLMNIGFTPVPRSRHPEMMPSEWKGNTIERDGQMLMEIPKIIADEIRLRDDANARKQREEKERQLGMAPRGGLASNLRAKVTKSYEPSRIADDDD